MACLQSVFATVALAEAGRAQSLEDTYVSSNWKNTNLEDAFASIQNQTDFFFTYDRKLVRDIFISNTNRNVALIDLLKYISSQTNLQFSIFKDIVYVLREKDEVEQPTAKTFIKVPEKAILEALISKPDFKVVYQVRGLNNVNDQIIRGRVTSTTGEALVGATILVKETGQGTVTDNNGNFTVAVPDGGQVKLVVSYVGYQTREVLVNGQTQVDIELAAASAELDEVVVIGYGTEYRGNISTSIGKLNEKDIRDQPVTSFDQALAGRLAGVDIAQTNGAPGASVAINIRGISSITGGNSPLIVVDGVPLSSSPIDQFSQGVSSANDFNVGYRLNPLSTINPNDIVSIEVLKDAASTAIYGSRGTNGVILITTKSGQFDQKPTISLNVYAGVQEVTKKIDVMDAYEFANYHKLSRDLSWIAKNPSRNTANDPNAVRGSGDRIAPYLFPYINGEQGLTNTDWQDEIFRTAPIQNYEVSANGGNNWLSYYVSGNYFDQQGIVINSGMKRYGARLNLNARLSEKIRFGINFNPSFSDHNIVQTEQNWFREGVIITALMYHPNLPVYNADGSYALGTQIRTNRNGEASVATIENPVALANEIENQLRHTRMLGNTFLEVNLLPGLKFKTSFGLDLNFMDRFYYRPKTLNWRTEYAPTTNFNYAWANNSTIYNWISENTFDYSKIIGKHNFTALLGYSSQKEHNARQYIEGRNFLNDNIITLNAAQTRTGFSEEREWSLLSYLGRIQYNFDGKYLFSASMRRDGSSRFGTNSKWGWFPSVSAGWRVSKESFFGESELISDLKIRGSYGLTGNTEIPFYGGTALLNLAGYVLSDQVVSGLAPRTSPNPNLSWETTRTLDIGVDAGFLNNKFSIIADFYQSNTKDLLLNVTIPSSSGFQTSLQNIGEMRNRGIELTVSTNQKFGNFSWNGSVNFSTNRNEVLALAPGQRQFIVNGGLNDPAFIVRVGEPIGSYFGYKVLGVFRTEEEFDALPKLENANQKIGDFIYADINGDGKVNADDRTVLGDNNPDYIIGFQSSFGFKNFDLSFNIQSRQGFELLNAMHRYTAEAWGNNLSIYLTDQAPRPVWGVGSASHTRPSSWHVEDGSFIRVRNITLGYAFPKGLSNKGSFNNLRVYASALNPFTWTKYSGYNPEVSNNFGDAIRAGEEFGNYPVSKSFVLGLNASF